MKYYCCLVQQISIVIAVIVFVVNITVKLYITYQNHFHMHIVTMILTTGTTVLIQPQIVVNLAQVQWDVAQCLLKIYPMM